jgi:hypothetical protein
MTQKYDRFKDAPWFQQGVRPPVLIGGAGGIGSWLTVLLNRAGFETFVYDHDSLEAINMAGQLYMHKSIGQTKVDALAEVVKELCQDDIVPNFAKIDETTMTNDIVFSAFDNMKARKDMFTTWAMNFKGSFSAIYIDGRLTAEQLTIFCIKGDDEKGIKEYMDFHLFDDSEVPDLPCTMAQTSHGAAMIAAHMTEFFTNWYSIVLGKDVSRNVPFFWEYMIPIGFMSTREAGQSFDSEIPPLQNEKELGETVETDLTLQEIQEIGDFLNERHNPTSEEAKEFIDFIAEGIPNPVSPNQPSNSSDSLDFEEDVNPESLPTTNPTHIDDLPF